MAIFLTEIVVSAKTLTHISLEAFHEIEEMSRKITRGRNKGNQNIKRKLDKENDKARQNKAMMEGKKKITKWYFVSCWIGQLFICYLIFQYVYGNKMGGWGKWIVSITTELIA